jgi:acetyltransferase
MALVAIHTDPKTQKEQIVALAQLTKLHGSADAEFAIQVRDAYQGTGLGTELLNTLLSIARNEGIERVLAEIMPENIGMRRICERLGFSFHRLPDSRNVVASIDLQSAQPPIETDEAEKVTE